MTNRNNNRRRPRRSQYANHIGKDFEPNEKLAAVWAELRGYGVYTHTRQGEPYDWATSRKQCNKKLNEAQREFDLRGLNDQRRALLSVDGLYNGRLDNEALTPIRLRTEVCKVQLIRTILLTAPEMSEEDYNAYLDELKGKRMGDLAKLRGKVRDRIWGENRKALRARIDKAVKKGKSKGKVRSTKSKRHAKARA